MIANIWTSTILWYSIAVGVAVAMACARRAWQFVAQRAWARRPAPIEPSVDRPDIVYTLVHGTWARNAEWTRARSGLRAQLRRISPDHAVRVFRWSGANRDSARREAARALSAYLEEGLAAFPAARHFVIGHSHGGNVSLDAITPELADRVGGLICLATPVIVTRKKTLDGLSGFFVRWFLVPPAFLLGGLTESATNVPEGALVFAFPAVAALAMLWVRRCVAFDAPETRPCVANDKAIFIRHAGDEASLAIGASSMAAIILEKIVFAPMSGLAAAKASIDVVRTVLMRDFNLAATVSSIAGGLLFLLVLWPTDADLVAEGPLATALFFLFGTAVCAIGFWLVFATYSYALLIYFLAFALAGLVLPPILIITSSLTAIALGPGLALAVITNHITVEVCPDGIWQIAHVTRDDGEGRDSGLQHSRVYESPISLAILSNWIKKRLAAV